MDQIVSGNTHRDRTRGFTLLELLVAISVAALVILGARAILHQIADTADRITATATEADRAANTERTIRALFERTVTADTATPFFGREQILRFASWCDMSGGWRERCTVSLTVGTNTQTPHKNIDSALTLLVRTSAGDTLELPMPGQNGAFRYVQDVANGGRWLSRWYDSTSTPLATGLVTDRDTLIFRIGERR